MNLKKGWVASVALLAFSFGIPCRGLDLKVARAATVSSYQRSQAFYLTDHLGSTRLVTDESGTEQARYAYYPYGELFAPPPRGEGGGEGEVSYLYTGQELDRSSELYYYGARYYDPKLVRFVSLDGVFDGLNPYAYVRGNPIRLNDPDGMAASEATDLFQSSQARYFEVYQEVLRQKDKNFVVFLPAMMFFLSQNLSSMPEEWKLNGKKVRLEDVLKDAKIEIRYAGENKIRYSLVGVPKGLKVRMKTPGGTLEGEFKGGEVGFEMEAEMDSEGELRAVVPTGRLTNYKASLVIVGRKVTSVAQYGVTYRDKNGNFQSYLYAEPQGVGAKLAAKALSLLGVDVKNLFIWSDIEKVNLYYDTKTGKERIRKELKEMGIAIPEFLNPE